MQSMIKNGSMAAKIRAKSGKLLSDNDFKTLAECTSIEDIAAYLKKTEGYGPFIETAGGFWRDKLEENIYFSLINDYESFYLFSNAENKKFLNLYFLKREIWIIKSLIYSILNSDTPSIESLPEKHRSFDTSEAQKCKSLSDLKYLLENTRYGGIIDESKTIFENETALDKYYFDCMFKAVESTKGEDKRAAEELIGSETDATNILWIVRAKEFYGMSPEKIRESVLPFSYKLSKYMREKMTDAANAGEVIGMTENTAYKELFAGGAKSNALSSYLLRLNYKILKKYPFSSVAALAFLHIKRFEIQNITSVIECVRYKINPEEIKNHLVK
ncbi:MAG: V-type ATPase subunit [Clostridia bacterium]|nr:V-type ATPase subunit [Clostridia bacterium]